MASSSPFLLSLFFLAFISSTNAIDIKFSKPYNPLILPVKKDDATLQYYSTFNVGSFSYKANAVIDLGGPFLWLNCNGSYRSSSYHAVECNTNECSAAGGSIFCSGCDGAFRPGCTNNTCGVFPYNPYNNSVATGGLGKDNIVFGPRSWKVSNFPLACGIPEQLYGLSKSAQGMIGLGKTPVSLPTQIFSAFNLPRKFAICVPSSGRHERFGGIVFGGGPYYMIPYPKDVSKLLVSTPLIVNPVSTAPVRNEGDASHEYFIGVKSIKIDGKSVPFNSSLLSIDKKGVGGAKISTVTPYTVLHTNIYKALVKEFGKSAASKKVASVTPVKPFGACFDSKTIHSYKTGSNVPVIDLVLQSESVCWRIHDSNSMVRVNKDVVCLGFVDGGSKPTTSIVVGGHQLEDNLLEFDIAASELRFSSSLLLYNTKCSHFKDV
ncbi:hypothetical protein SLA2020_528450 [Shorea laevis]